MITFSCISRFIRYKDLLFSFYGEIYNCGSLYFLALGGKSHVSFAQWILGRGVISIVKASCKRLNTGDIYTLVRELLAALEQY